MALSTYDGLIGALGALLDRTDLAAAIPDFVTAVEAEINGKIRVRQMICRSQGVIRNEFERVPINFAGVKTLHLLTEPAGPLRFADSGEILRAKAATTAGGRPSMFSVVGEEFQFYPRPDTDYPVELATYETLPPLAVQGSNWLLARYPNVYLYGAARHAAPYLRDDERLPLWTALFEEGLAAIRYADREEAFGDRPAMRAKKEHRMSDLSDFAENLVATWLLTDAAVTRPAARYVALYTTAPSDAGGGTEVTGGGYARQAFGASAAGADAANAGEIAFSAIGGGWGTIRAVGIFDASSGGNLLVWKALSPTVSIGDGEALVYPAGSLIGRAA